MRTVKIKGVKVELSKSEAEFVSKLSANNTPGRNGLFASWYGTAPNDQARARRQAVGMAFGIKGDGIVTLIPPNTYD